MCLHDRFATLRTPDQVSDEVFFLFNTKKDDTGSVPSGSVFRRKGSTDANFGVTILAKMMEFPVLCS